MFHVTLIGIIAVLSLLGWSLANSAPRQVSILLPRNLTFALGAFLLIVGIFFAFFGAFAIGDYGAIIGCLVQSFVGLFLIFAGSAGLRGDPFYDQTTRRIGMMMALIIVMLVAVYYLPDARFVSLLNAGLLAGGFVLTADLRQSQHR
jgi:hypothetical protein